ncbi:MAG: TetR/AcrR family transcriptional regulator [Spirochaetes bacterium]|nr:TetR/AcrR family transcriptional regulator [Spirochaetota bacterium]
MKSKSKATEEKVFKSAEMLMSRYGIKGWNMNDLAAASGITKRTLYKIITSKEQLIRDVAQNNINAMREKLFDIIKKGEGFMESLEMMIVAIPELLKNNYVNNYSDILNEFPELEAELVRENEKLSNDLLLFFQRGIDSGFIRDNLTPAFINQMFHGMIIHFAKYSSSEIETAEKLNLALRSLIYGIRSRQPD